MASAVPIILQVDCEPDARVTRHAAGVDWRGVEAMARLLDAWRGEAARVTGAPANVNWFWRADPQVAEDHGDAGWAFERFGGLIERQAAAGDAIGLHVHCWRWCAEGAAAGWLNDHGDRAWVAHCLDEGFAAFRRHFGRTAEDFRMGDGFMDQAAFDRLVSLGVKREQSLEPGRPAMPGLQAAERSRGSLPDRRTMPLAPYRPRRGAYLEPAGAGGAGDGGAGDGAAGHAAPIWVIPCTTGPACPSSLRRDGSIPFEQANLEYRPETFRQIARNGMGRLDRPYGALAMRSSAALAPQSAQLEANLAWLLELAKEKPLRFVTAEGFLERRVRRERPAASPRRDYSAALGAGPLSFLTIFSAMRARLPVRPRR